MSIIGTAFRCKNILKPYLLHRLLSSSSCLRKSIKVNEELEDESKPIKYTTTPASKWQAKNSRMGIMDKRLWYEPYVIMVSITVFLIYFCMLREENDVDLELNQSLYKRIPGLEEQQLHVVLRYNREHGLETKDIIERLEELRAEKST